MSSRVTFGQVNSMVQNNIAANYRRLSDMQEKLSSGKVINRPSDAPVDITSDLQLRSDINQLSQYKRNIDDGVSYMSMVESTLSNTNSLYQRARELGIQGANDTNTVTERGYINKEIRQIFDQLVAVANSSFKGNYLFSGTETETPPYEMRGGADTIDALDNSALDPSDTSLAAADPLPKTIQLWDRGVTDSNTPNGQARAYDIIPGTLTVSGLTEGTDYQADYVNGTITFLPPGGAAVAAAAAPGGLSVQYEWVRRSEKNLDGTISREMGRGLVGQINTTATEVFGSTNGTTSFDSVIKLMEGMHKNSSATIEGSIGELSDALKRALNAQATAGARTNRLETSDTRNEAYSIETSRLQSEIEDVDMAKLISDFLLQESVYTASLQSGARVIQPTLANFL